jgi:berberine-like enzyme
MWPDAADNDANIQWVRDYYDATAPLSEEGGCINFMAGDDQDRIKANYKGNYERLVEVKRRYDPRTSSTSTRTSGRNEASVTLALRRRMP